VNAGSTVVEAGLADVNVTSAVVETVRLIVEARRATVDFASTVIRVNPCPSVVEN